MKFTILQRKTERKSDAKKMRREGHIPAVLYGPKQSPRAIAVKAADMQAMFRSLQPQMLATTVFHLVEGDKTYSALIKDVAYHPASYGVQHVDFYLLSEEVPITVNVPVKILGAMECAGVKLGGFIRQPIRSLKVRCLPRDLPKEFVVDVQNLEIGQAKRLSDLSIPKGIKPLASMEELVVVVAKKV